MEREQLDEVLARHAKWLRWEDPGGRASLDDAVAQGLRGLLARRSDARPQLAHDGGVVVAERGGVLAQ